MQREVFIDEVLSMLELSPIAHKLCSALSRGERKLLTVGVELVRSKAGLARMPALFYLSSTMNAWMYFVGRESVRALPR